MDSTKNDVSVRSKPAITGIQSNACAESFFHSMKVEAIHGERFAIREKIRQPVLEYIEVNYNLTRRHGVNGHISPEAFEARKVAQLGAYCSRAGSL